MSTLAEQRRQKVASQVEETRAETKAAKEIAGKLSPELIVDDYTMGRITERLIEKGTIQMNYEDFQVDSRSDYFSEVAKSYKANDHITDRAFGGTISFRGCSGDCNYQNKRLMHMIANPSYVYTVVADYLRKHDISLTETEGKDVPCYTLSIIGE